MILFEMNGVAKPASHMNLQWIRGVEIRKTLYRISRLINHRHQFNLLPNPSMRKALPETATRPKIFSCSPPAESWKLSYLHMEPADTGKVTGLLLAWGNGDKDALERLVPLVESELRRLARIYLRRERAGHTLQTNALVNEAYLRLIDAKKVHWENRSHFFGVAARLMRQILVDYARRRRSLKHGGATVLISLSEAAFISVANEDDFLAL